VPAWLGGSCSAAAYNTPCSSVQHLLVRLTISHLPDHLLHSAVNVDGSFPAYASASQHLAATTASIWIQACAHPLPSLQPQD
jgi:hypothetical protein